MFCPNCKSLMMPKDGKLYCSKCDDSKKITRKDREAGTVTEKMTEKQIAVYDKETGSNLPIMPASCPKKGCDGDEAEFYMRQTRAADEPSTRFYKCTTCGHKWREF